MLWFDDDWFWKDSLNYETASRRRRRSKNSKLEQTQKWGRTFVFVIMWLILLMVKMQEKKISKTQYHHNLIEANFHNKLVKFYMSNCMFQKIKSLSVLF